MGRADKPAVWFDDGWPGGIAETTNGSRSLDHCSLKAIAKLSLRNKKLSLASAKELNLLE